MYNIDPIWFVIVIFLLLGYGLYEVAEKAEQKVKEVVKNEEKGK